MTRRRRRRQLPGADLFGQVWQQGLHTRLGTKALFEPGVDAFPHPGQGLLLTPLLQTSVVGLQTAKFGYRIPEAIHAVAFEGAFTVQGSEFSGYTGSWGPDYT